MTMLDNRPHLEILPSELLYQIVSYLSTDPPSTGKVHGPPSPQIVRSDRHDLKDLSRTSSRFIDLVRPLLFTHACCDIREIDSFLSFVQRLRLRRHVTSIVILVHTEYLIARDFFWWRRALGQLDPLRVTIVAAPTALGETTSTKIIDVAHSWAFDIPFQILQLKQQSPSVQDGRQGGGVPERFTCPDLSTCPSLMHARKWDVLVVNESSFLKTYNHYEYFLFKIPSLLHTWGSSTRVAPRMGSFLSVAALSFLTTFRYTAVFPFYNHIRVVLDVVELLMANLQSLTVQLAPGRNNRVIEDEQRGSMDPNDPWMELSTGYSLIAHTVRDLGARRRLTRFQACDYDIEALRSNLSMVVGDVLPDNQWVHDGQGTWTKIEGQIENDVATDTPEVNLN